jgi:hypothetical protein
VLIAAGFGAAAADDRPTRAITGRIDIKRRFFMGRASFGIGIQQRGEYKPMNAKRIQVFRPCTSLIII